MKKNVPDNSSDKHSKVKEISDGVYINLNRITSDEDVFEKAIEESFKKLEDKKPLDSSPNKVEKSKSSH